MASWTTPKTYSGGSELTASELNTYQRDNQTWLKDALTANGITSDTTHTRYTGCMVTRDTLQALPASVTTQVIWTAEPWDSDGYFTLGNAGWVTIPVGSDGDYEVAYTVTTTAGSRASSYLAVDLVALPGGKCSVASSGDYHLSGTTLWLGASAGEALSLHVTALTADTIAYAELWIKRFYT